MMPPYYILPDLLAEDEVTALLDYALSERAHFRPTGTGPHQRIDPAVRHSLVLRALGPFGSLLRARLRAVEPALGVALGMPLFDDAPMEVEIVAHGDGAFYRLHRDIETGSPSRSIRVLSMVYYFHRRPQGFSGGALRLHAIGDPGHGCFVDIPPTHNSLLVFPSWAPHEVRPVHCPSHDFADSRFAINTWLRHSLPPV